MEWLATRGVTKGRRESDVSKLGLLKQHERYLTSFNSSGAAAESVELLVKLSRAGPSPSRQLLDHDGIVLLPSTTVLTRAWEFYSVVCAADLFPQSLLCQSALRRCMKTKGFYVRDRLEELLVDPQRQIHVFMDELCSETSTPIGAGETDMQRVGRSLIASAELLSRTPGTKARLVILAFDEREAADLAGLEHAVDVYTCHQVLDLLVAEENLFISEDRKAQLQNLLERLAHTQATADTTEAKFAGQPHCHEGSHFDPERASEYWTHAQIASGLENRTLVRGKLEYVHQEAWLRNIIVSADGEVVHKDSGLDTKLHYGLLLPGPGGRNRALEGDEVVAVLLPPQQWRVPRSQLKLADGDDGEAYASTSDQTTGRGVPTGFVVGVHHMHRRTFVATIQSDQQSLGAGRRNMLAVPVNRRIPKVRLQSLVRSQHLQKRLLIAIDRWDVQSRFPEGHILKVLGPVGDFATEAEVILFERGLHDHLRQFGASAMAELPDRNIDGSAPISARDLLERLDLRSTHKIVSIDPPGCEDIDDALSVRKLPGGNIEFGVHIADVTAYVAEGSALDLEALHRGTTVYLVDKRLDMLPQLLSADLCSLLAGFDRLAVSVFWECTPAPDFAIIPSKTRFARSIIRSKYALSYDQAQDIVDGRSPGFRKVSRPGVCGGRVDPKDIGWLAENIGLLRDAGRVFLQERLRQDAMSLGSAEVSFAVDPETGKPTNVSSKPHMEVHSTIEEWMLAANRAVAEQIVSVFPKEALVRRHDSPSMDRMGVLRDMFSELGVDFNAEVSLAANLKRASHVAPSPAALQLVKSAAIKVMAEALYCCMGQTDAPGRSFASDVAHFGVGMKYYTHFTSPIRRYADVVVHRLLLASCGEHQMPPYSVASVISIADHLNQRNRTAKGAGMDSRALFLALYFGEHPRLADAVVSGIRDNGFLVFVAAYGIAVPVYLDSDNSGKPARTNEGEAAAIFSQRHNSGTALTVFERSSGRRLLELQMYSKVKVKLTGETHESATFRTPRVKAHLIVPSSTDTDSKSDSTCKSQEGAPLPKTAVAQHTPVMAAPERQFDSTTVYGVLQNTWMHGCNEAAPAAAEASPPLGVVCKPRHGGRRNFGLVREQKVTVNLSHSSGQSHAQKIAGDEQKIKQFESDALRRVRKVAIRKRKAKMSRS